MTYLDELLDRTKAACGLPSDYALAKKLQVNKATVSAWRQGRCFPEWETIFKMVDLIEEDDQIVVHKFIELKKTNPRLIKALQTMP